MMAAAPDTHSRIVFWLKILLPVCALGILSTLFLFSRDVGPEGLLPISNVDVEELAREQRITNPEFSGMTKDGAAVTIRADAARPATGTEDATIENVRAEYLRNDGDTIRLQADHGRVDTDRGIFLLSGQIVLETGSGYRIETDQLQGQLDRTQLTAPGPVSASAPMGTLTAGRMELSRSSAGADDSDLLVFKDGVRLVYEPRK